MKSKKIILTSGLLLTSLMLGGCGNLEKSVKNTQTSEVISNKKTITTGRVDESVYQAVMEKGKYQTNAGKDVSAGNSVNNSNYNQSNYETGLLHLSNKTFSPDKFYFQEGQQLSADTLKKWLGRKSTTNPDGLNGDDDTGPILLQKIIEYDFIDKDTQALGGLSIALIMNQTYYPPGGAAPIETPVDQLTSQGKAMAEEMLKNLRKIEGLENIPIVFGLFQQAPKADLAGGNFIASAVSNKGADSIGNWEAVEEAHILLPVSSSASNLATQDGLAVKFNEFKSEFQGYFPSASGVNGLAYYRDNTLKNLSITIETKYYSKTEITSMTQFAAKTAEAKFNMESAFEIQINSLEGTEAFIAKEAGSNSIYSHIFQ